MKEQKKPFKGQLPVDGRTVSLFASLPEHMHGYLKKSVITKPVFVYIHSDILVGQIEARAP